MNIRFTRHALDRMKERFVSRTQVNDALHSPDKLDQNRECFVAKKISAGQRLLLVFFKKELDIVIVITVIETSKLNKYF
jgi:hypothetical protein